MKEISISLALVLLFYFQSEYAYARTPIFTRLSRVIFDISDHAKNDSRSNLERVTESNFFSRKTIENCTFFHSHSNCSATKSSTSGPYFTSQPLPYQVVCATGSTSPLTVAYGGGSGTATFQWYSNFINSNSGGTLITSATSPSYAPPSTNIGIKFYYCKVSFSSSLCAPIYSSTAQVTVNQVVTITSQPPTSQTICVGGSPNTLSITLNSSNLNTSYTWFVNSSNTLSGAAVIPDATLSYYTPAGLNAGSYYYIVSASFANSGCSSVISNGANVIVNSDPSIISQPANNTVCLGGNPQALFFTVEGGAGSASYQWYSNTIPSISSSSPINLANSNVYDPPVQINEGNTYYYAQIGFSGNGCSSVNTNIAVINVSPDPVIIAQPITYQNICPGEQAEELSVSISGVFESAVYNWYFNPSNSTSGGVSVFSSEQSYAPYSEGPGLAYYFCTISFTSQGCNTLTTNVATINTLNSPSVTISETQLTACEGYSSMLSLSTDADISSSDFNWYSGSAPSGITLIPNANNSSTQISFNGDQLTYVVCSVTNNLGCINYSDTCVVQSMFQPEIITILPSQQNICLGGTPEPLNCTIESPSVNSSIEYFMSTIPYTFDGLSLGSSGTNFPEFSFPIERTFFAVYHVDLPNCLPDTSNLVLISSFEDPSITFSEDEYEIACINQGEIIINLEESNPLLNADYTWFINNNTYDSGSTFYLTTQGAEPSIQSISAMAIYAEAGCDTTFTSVPLSINYIPEPILSSYVLQESEFCIFDDTNDSLAVVVNSEISSNQFYYQWFVSDTDDYTLANPIANANYSYYKPNEDVAGDYYYFCQVDFLNTYCDVIKSPLTKIIFMPPSDFCFENLLIPNAISPNGDNLNDKWNLSDLLVYGTFSVNIWNQYGQIIFSGNEKTDSWDGKYNGQSIPIGDYYYQIEIPIVSRTFSGTVSINY
jgi:gliding motility-associated-like protein